MKKMILASALFCVAAFGQAGTPFLNLAATVPPAIGQPGATLAWDTTNKLLVVTITVSNATGVATSLTSFSYNPRMLEGVNGGGVTFSTAGVTIQLSHNLATDPLKYSIGTVTTMLASCVTTTPTTGQTACPVVPF